MVRRAACIATLLLALAGIAKADSVAVTVDLGPPRFIGSPQEVRMMFGGLGGTPVSGQSQSINVLFANGEWIFGPSGPFDVVLNLSTGVAGCPGFMNGTGSFLAKDGTLLFNPIQLGSACSSNGSMAVGIISPPLTGPYSAYGFRFDVTYPTSPGRTVRDGELILSITDRSGGVFVEPLPEPGTLILLAAGLGILGLAALAGYHPVARSTSGQ
jgi:hypothetical protein